MLNLALFLLICCTLASAVKWNELKLKPPPSENRAPRNDKADWELVVEAAQIATRDHSVSWGKWSKPTFCGEHMFIWGYNIIQDQNLATFERIDFICHGISKTEFHHSEAVIMSSNFNVSTGAKAEKTIFKSGSPTFHICEFHEGPLIGYSIIQEDKRQQNSPDAGVVGFAGICGSGVNRTMFKVNYWDSPDRIKTGNATCAEGHAACGFRLRYQYEASFKGIVDVDIFCCEVKRDFDNCKFNKEYKVVAAVDNRENPITSIENIQIVRTVEISKRVTSIQTQAWDKTHKQGITDTYLTKRLQQISREETNNKFDRPANLRGLLQSIGDVASGLTGFLKKGVGALINSAGLGDLLNIPKLPTLVGEQGYENVASLDDVNLEFYFKDTLFENAFSSIGSVFDRINDFTEDRKLEKAWAFQGYDASLRGFRPMFQSPTRVAEGNANVLQKLIGEHLPKFQDMKLFDIVGLYGLVKAYGLQVQEMAQNGELQKSMNLGTLGRKNWNEGIGKITCSENVGFLFKVMALATIFHPNLGLGIKFQLDKKLKIDGLAEATNAVHTEMFKSEAVEEGIWSQTFTVFALSQVLGSEDDNAFLSETYNTSDVGKLLGDEGLENILKSKSLGDWIKVSNSLELCQENLFQLYSLLGLAPTIPELATKLGSERFKKIVGKKTLQQILGSTEFDQPKDIANLLGIYGINYVFKNLSQVNLVVDDVDYTQWSSKVDTYTMLGETLGIYSIGNMYGLEDLRRLTGSDPNTLDAPGKLRKKRQFLMGLATAFMTGVKGLFSGGKIFSNLLGKGPGGGIKKQTIDEESDTLTETYKKSRSKKISESRSDKITLTIELKRVERNETKEAIKNEYQAYHLTLVVIPKLDCEGFYSVDLTDKKNYISVLVPNARRCEPIPYYQVVAGFDYLEESEPELRMFFYNVGSEWSPIRSYANTPVLRDIILRREPTRGIRQRIKKYRDELKGDQHIHLGEALYRDVETDQVWKPPAVYQEETLVQKHNYNMLLQLVIKCGEVLTYSSSVENFRFPKIFGVTTSAYWDLLHPQYITTVNETNKVWKGAVGFLKGGKDIQRLQTSQLMLPEVQNQLQRILKEIQGKVLAGEVTKFTEFSLKDDLTIIRNDAWHQPTPTKDAVPMTEEIRELGPNVYQLVVKCGPFHVGLRKFKINFRNGTTEETLIRPGNIPAEPVEDNDLDECSGHFPC